MRKKTLTDIESEHEYCSKCGMVQESNFTDQRAQVVLVLVVGIGTMIVIAIVAIREKEIALIRLRKTNSQSFLENNLKRR